MTETQDAAVKAWEALFNWGMPPAIAVDFVQEQTGDREAALTALLEQAMAFGRDAPRSVGEKEWGRWADNLLLLLHRREWNAADYEREWMRVGIALARRNAELSIHHRGVPAIDCELWLTWLSQVKRQIDLCRQLALAAKPGGHS